MDNKGKIIAAAAVALTGLVASKGIEGIWRLATGHKAPGVDTDDSVTKVIVFAALSAAAVTAVQAFASKKANKFIEQKGL